MFFLTSQYSVQNYVPRHFFLFFLVDHILLLYILLFKDLTGHDLRIMSFLEVLDRQLAFIPDVLPDYFLPSSSGQVPH